MKKRTTDNDTCAPEQGDSTMQGDLFNNSAEFPRPRKLELLAAGYDIALVWDQVITESGETHRIGRYVLMTKPQEVTP